MKRKLNADGVPEPVSSESKPQTTSTFDNFGLDPRLLQAVRHEKFFAPTLVQQRVIPVALEGRDILAHSRTGSGKTAAYLLPILQSILSRKSKDSSNAISALILVPTRELAAQITKSCQAFASYCAHEIKTENLARNEDQKVQRARLSSIPDILVGTPGKISAYLNESALSLNRLACLVIDEADLVLSYGYEDDLNNISQSIPDSAQSILMSATLRTELDRLKEQFCTDPQIIDLDEEEKDEISLSQYVVKCAEDEKFLLVYAIFMLKLIKGKVIIFVADIDRCYRLKLFLEQFGVKSCVLNSELPVNSRLHVVEEFNLNIYDIIIATDENDVVGSEDQLPKNSEELQNEKWLKTHKGSATAQEAASNSQEKDLPKATDGQEQREQTDLPRKKRKSRKQDKEYGVARGIDFKNVTCVLNFDLPSSSRSYIHRIGRTARAGRSGMALSFVIPAVLYRKHKPTSIESAKRDEAVLEEVIKNQEIRGQKVFPYHFDMQRLDGFRYRLTDALRAVTRLAVREARTREIRQELMKSEKLKRHFEENPTDLHHLRHDGELRSARVQTHLKHIPDYLLPNGGKRALAESDPGFVGLRKATENRIRRARMFNKGKVSRSRKLNPLKSFSSKSRR